MDLREVLSIACTDVLKTSVDEVFRKRTMGLLGVTNATDAKAVLTEKLKNLKNRPQRNLNVTSRSASPHNPSVSSAVQGQGGGVSSDRHDAAGLKLQDNSNASHKTSPNQPHRQNEEENDCGSLDSHLKVNGVANYSTTKMADVSSSKEGRDLAAGQENTGLEIKVNSTMPNHTEPSQSILLENEHEKDDFDSWNLIEGKRFSEKGEGVSSDKTAEASVSRHDAAGLKLQNNCHHSDKTSPNQPNRQKKEEKAFDF